ncbi:tetratricopeptide repeat protein [Chitinophaga polysaccharea]|uniref:tetratricopeptide repeat-containing sensor histidine kinase n=1 Tax=Chitinophaga polysaccharea TaxID=1293035 RepID=UPI001455A836|nr:tetratricopeptide repeat protein [Chitinophaga polysaccharea]NLR56978.1 tetratricopeptide repeat protein [Chitinophaga polysaccharea]
MSIKGVCFLCWLLLGACLGARAQDSLRTYRLLDSVRQLRADTAKVSLLIKKGGENARYFDNHKLDNPFWQEALTLSQQLRFFQGISRAYNEIGTSKRNKSLYIVAEDYHEKALKAAEEAKDTSLIVFSLNNAGVDCRRLDKLQKGFDYHMRALVLAEQINDIRNICVATNSIGNIQLTMEKYADAIQHFNRALALEEKSHNDLGVAINLGNLGYAYQGQGKLDLAIQYYKRSLNMNLKMDRPIGIAICYNALGAAYKEKKDYAAAMYYLEKALEVNDQVDDKVHVAESYLSIGKLLGAQAKHEEARKYIQQSIDVSTFWGFKSMLMDAYKALAEDYKESGDFEKSLEAVDKSLLYKDSILDEKSAMALTQMQTIYEVDRKDNQIRTLEHDKMLGALRTKRNVAISFFLAAFLLMAIVGGFFYIRHRNLKANKQTLQLELRSLRSQMNPHFIFNSLSSIHRYIWSNNQEEASDYLTKFSRLMRLILDNTQHTFVTLNKELESLRLYLDLESLRCNGIFEYRFQIDTAINDEEVLIPPMILQPYVENAIWHGLVHKLPEEKGLLDISIILQKRSLVCTITDNGIGRKKAMEIKDRKGRMHNSVGMKVTEGRIDLIRKINNKEATVTVTDLEDESGKATGTRVTIVLPAEFIF